MSSGNIRRNNFLKVGVPLVTFCVLGFVGLTQVVKGKKELEDMQRGRRSISTRDYDLEEDYKETLKKLNIDDFEMVRIQRPKDD